MKGFVKLTKETWKFYLTVLIVCLLFVIGSSLYLCNELKFKYIDDISSFKADGIVFDSLIVDKAQNNDVLGFFTVVAGIMIVLLIRHFFFINQRTKEFQSFLPVKQRTWVIHDFVSMLGIIIVSFLVMTGIFLSAQTRYNKDMLKAAGLHHIEGMNDGLIALANGEMLTCILYYFIFIFFVFTLIYLGMLVCRNSLAGGMIAVVAWWFCVSTLDEIYWGISSDDIYTTEIENLVKKADWLRAAVNPDEFFRWKSGNWQECTSISLTASLSLIFVLLIVIAAGRIEGSKGKLFYFAFLDYLFSIFCGVSITYYAIFYIDGAAFLPFVLVIGVLTMVVVWWLIHPGKQKTTNNWEVK